MRGLEHVFVLLGRRQLLSKRGTPCLCTCGVCLCVCAPMGAASSLVSLHRVDERSTHTRCCVQSTMAHAMPPSVVARLRAMPGNKVRW